MVWLHAVIIAFSLVIIVLFLFLRSEQTYDPSVPVSSVAVLVLSLWLVAGAVWGSEFFALRIPGFIAVTADRSLFGLLCVLFGLGVLRGHIDLRQRMSVELWMLLFGMVCLFSLLRHGFKASQPEFVSPSFVFVTGYLLPFLAFLFAKHWIVAEREVIWLFRTLFVFAVYLAVTAYFEFYDLRDLVFPRYINDPRNYLHLDRARGPFLNAAFNGLALVYGFMCGLHLTRLRKGPTRLLWLLLLALILPALFFTQTRSVYLCLAVGLAAHFALLHTSWPKWKVVVLVLVLLSFLVAAASPRLLSGERRKGGVYQVEEVQIRFALIRMSMHMFMDHPLFGVGLAQFVPYAQRNYLGRVPIPHTTKQETQHNHLLGMLVELGLTGILVYLGLIFCLMKKTYQVAVRLRTTGFLDAYVIAVVAGVWAAYLVNNVFVEPSFCLFINVVPFMLAGIVDGLHNRLQK
jgi:O-antigen ligase